MMTAAEVMACFVETDQRMQALPFYNPHLEVEVHDWQFLDEVGHLGILITPWCLRLLVFPHTATDLPAFGQDFNLSLPSGDYQLQAAQHDLLGSYATASLRSDMLDFANQSQVREMAVAVMQLLLQPPLALPENPGRRRLLGGRL